MRVTLELLLDIEGFRVAIATDGETALSTARRERPDVILLDHFMPKMTGREVLGELKRDPATSSIPVLVLSGLGVDAGAEWEGAEFIGKPFSPGDLVARIKELAGGG